MKESSIHPLAREGILNWNCLSPERGGDVLVMWTMMSRIIILGQEEN